LRVILAALLGELLDSVVVLLCMSSLFLIFVEAPDTVLPLIGLAPIALLLSVDLPGDFSTEIESPLKQLR